MKRLPSACLVRTSTPRLSDKVNMQSQSHAQLTSAAVLHCVVANTRSIFGFGLVAV